MCAHFGRTVEDLGAALSSAEMAEWIAFDNLYGFPDLYYQTAMICSTLEGIWSEKPRPVEKIVPYFGAGQPGSSDDDLAARFKIIAAQSAARAGRNGSPP
jgi:hypothetical protein